MAPARFRPQCAGILVCRLARAQSSVRVCNQMAKLDLPAVVEGRLQAVLFADGQAVPAAHVRRTVKAILEEPPSGQRLREDWTIDFLELVAFTDTPSLRDALDLMGPLAPEPSSFDRTLEGWGPMLRLHALIAAAKAEDADPEALIPSDLRSDQDADDPEDRRSEERKESRRRELMKISNRFLPVFHVRARGLVGKLSAAALGAAVESELKAYEVAAANRWYEGDPTYGTWTKIVAEVAARTSRGDASHLLNRMVDQAPRVTAFHGATVWRRIAEPLLHRDRYRDLSFRMLDRAAVTIEESEEPASEKADQILEVSGLLEHREESLAADYFDRAVGAAEGLDTEGSGVLEVNAALARQARGSDPTRNASVAERLARSVERFRPFVGDPDELPWATTAGAVATLDPAAGMALLNRWEEENFCPLSSSLPEVIEACQAAEFLTADEGLLLLGLAEDHVYSTGATTNLLGAIRGNSGASVKRLEAAVGRLADFVERELLPESRLRVARAVSAWLKEQGLASTPAARGLIDLAHFSEELHPEESRSQISHTTLPSRSERQEAKRLLVEGASGSPGTIGSGLAALTDSYATDEEIREYLEATRDRMPPQDRVAALSALGELSVEGHLWSSHGAVIFRSIGDWATAWGQAGTVKEWGRTSLPIIVQEHFLALVRYPEYAEQNVAAILALPFLEDPASLIIETLGPSLPALSARQLHAIASGLAPALTREQSLAIVEWSLDALEDDASPPTPALPEGGPAALALLLWALFETRTSASDGEQHT